MYEVGDKVKIYIHNSRTKEVEIIRKRRFWFITFYLFLGTYDGYEGVQWYSEKHIIGKFKA